MVLILKGSVLSVRDIMIKWLDLLNTELLSTQANALHKILNTAPTKSGLFADYLLLWKVWQIILYIKLYKTSQEGRQHGFKNVERCLTFLHEFSVIWGKKHSVHTKRFLKFVWPFHNIMHERVNVTIIEGTCCI